MGLNSTWQTGTKAAQGSHAAGAKNISTIRGGHEREALMRDGEVFRREYMRDAQFIFSRVQHHAHKKTKAVTCP